MKREEGGVRMSEIALEKLIQEDQCDEVLQELMIDYGQDVLQLVYSYVKSRDIAEDLTQEIFVKCYKALPTYKGQAKMKTWLWRIAINHCKDYFKSWHYRKVMVSEKLSLFSSPKQKSVEEEVIQKSEDESLVSVVMNLPIKYREVIYLFYFEEMSLKQIEELIGIKQNTVKTRLRRAKELLKDELKEAEQWMKN